MPAAAAYLVASAGSVRMEQARPGRTMRLSALSGGAVDGPEQVRDPGSR
ncbi:hypothetical protein GV791_12505 [Nocardia cyriacigeorgica]|uniref:Uncharacterized protein n=1 Tax=Nocardia cyriacigeorgica TaxID=135487 RepID=A0A6P1CQ74_9NOCA|nr:hypothetical protein [Nocardia cyriacigeorgica]MBF6288387.1 hypothetical protein [Nocardia cyriacigeorgica]MBF6427164.1 hypothetical protein [Nocardia cyriacigeorgica]NEW33376.1 hypothetical protein [Nocardia cyriacigeorgica]